jgi:hypothetical protein
VGEHAMAGTAQADRVVRRRSLHVRPAPLRPAGPVRRRTHPGGVTPRWSVTYSHYPRRFRPYRRIASQSGRI